MVPEGVVLDECQRNRPDAHAFSAHGERSGLSPRGIHRSSTGAERRAAGDEVDIANDGR